MSLTAAERRTETARLNQLQEALEAEEHKTALELHHIRRSLDHLRRCRYELTTGKTPTRNED